MAHPTHESIYLSIYPQNTQEFDLDQTFGEVKVGSTIDGVIELRANMNQNAVHEFTVKVSQARPT